VLSKGNDTIMLVYWVVDDVDFLEAFTDGYLHEQIEINGLSAEAITDPKSVDANALVWINNNNTICFNLSGKHPVEELIKIAEGISEK